MSGARISFAVPDWEDRLARGATPIPDLPLHKGRAALVAKVFDSLRLPDVAGHPALRDVAGPWFRDCLVALLANADPETGAPVANQLFCLVPKKNAKTTYSGALGLTALLTNDDPNQKMVILGPTQNIAQRCFDQAHGMIKLDPRLRRIFHVNVNEKIITRLKTNSALAVKTFDLNVVTGEIPALTIIDELHVISAKAYAQRVIAQITGGMITNDRAKLVFITTQSDTRPQGEFAATLEYARGVRDGRITDGVRMIPCLYEFPVSIQADDDKPWRDPALWPMVLPNLGRSVKLQLLTDHYAAELEKGAEAEAVWASQHLNIEIGVGLAGDGWGGARYWAACGDPGLTLAALLAEADVCTVGIDWGGADDLASIAVLGRSRVDRAWLHWSRSWARPSVFQRRKSIASTLRDFERDGDLRLCPTGEAQAQEGAEVVAQVYGTGLLPEKEGIGCDVAAISLLTDAMEARGMLHPLVVGVPQNWQLQNASQTLALKLEDRRIRHGNQRIMAWAAGNAKQALIGNSYRITKQTAGAAKIDPVAATFNAAMLMNKHPVAASSGAEPRVRAL